MAKSASSIQGQLLIDDMLANHEPTAYARLLKSAEAAFTGNQLQRYLEISLFILVRMSADKQQAFCDQVLNNKSHALIKNIIACINKAGGAKTLDVTLPALQTDSPYYKFLPEEAPLSVSDGSEPSLHLSVSSSSSTIPLSLVQASSHHAKYLRSLLLFATLCYGLSRELPAHTHLRINQCRLETLTVLLILQIDLYIRELSLTVPDDLAKNLRLIKQKFEMRITEKLKTIDVERYLQSSEAKKLSLSKARITCIEKQLVAPQLLTFYLLMQEEMHDKYQVVMLTPGEKIEQIRIKVKDTHDTLNFSISSKAPLILVFMEKLSAANDNTVIALESALDILSNHTLRDDYISSIATTIWSNFLATLRDHIEKYNKPEYLITGVNKNMTALPNVKFNPSAKNPIFNEDRINTILGSMEQQIITLEQRYRLAIMKYKTSMLFTNRSEGNIFDPSQEKLNELIKVGDGANITIAAYACLREVIKKNQCSLKTFSQNEKLSALANARRNFVNYLSKARVHTPLESRDPLFAIHPLLLVEMCQYHLEETLQNFDAAKKLISSAAGSGTTTSSSSMSSTAADVNYKGHSLSEWSAETSKAVHAYYVALRSLSRYQYAPPCVYTYLNLLRPQYDQLKACALPMVELMVGLNVALTEGKLSTACATDTFWEILTQELPVFVSKAPPKSPTTTKTKVTVSSGALTQEAALTQETALKQERFMLMPAYASKPMTELSHRAAVLMDIELQRLPLFPLGQATILEELYIQLHDLIHYNYHFKDKTLPASWFEAIQLLPLSDADSATLQQLRVLAEFAAQQMHRMAVETQAAFVEFEKLGAICHTYVDTHRILAALVVLKAIMDEHKRIASAHQHDASVDWQQDARFVLSKEGIQELIATWLMNFSFPFCYDGYIEKIMQFDLLSLINLYTSFFSESDTLAFKFNFTHIFNDYRLKSTQLYVEQLLEANFSSLASSLQSSRLEDTKEKYHPALMNFSVFMNDVIKFVPNESQKQAYINFMLFMLTTWVDKKLSPLFSTSVAREKYVTSDARIAEENSVVAIKLQLVTGVLALFSQAMQRLNQATSPMHTISSSSSMPTAVLLQQPISKTFTLLTPPIQRWLDTASSGIAELGPRLPIEHSIERDICLYALASLQDIYHLALPMPASVIAMEKHLYFDTIFYLPESLAHQTDASMYIHLIRMVSGYAKVMPIVPELGTSYGTSGLRQNAYVSQFVKDLLAYQPTTTTEQAQYHSWLGRLLEILKLSVKAPWLINDLSILDNIMLLCIHCKINIYLPCSVDTIDLVLSLTKHKQSDILFSEVILHTFVAILFEDLNQSIHSKSFFSVWYQDFYSKLKPNINNGLIDSIFSMILLRTINANIHHLEKLPTQIMYELLSQNPSYRLNIQKTLSRFGIDRAKIYPLHRVTAVVSTSTFLIVLRKIDLNQVNASNITTIFAKLLNNLDRDKQSLSAHMKAVDGLTGELNQIELVVKAALLPSDLEKLMGLLKIAHESVYREAGFELAINGVDHENSQESLSDRQYIDDDIAYRVFAIIKVFSVVLSDFSPHIVMEFRKTYLRTKLFNDINDMFLSLHDSIHQKIISQNVLQFLSAAVNDSSKNSITSILTHAIQQISESKDLNFTWLKDFLTLLQCMIRDIISHQSKFKEEYNITENVSEFFDLDMFRTIIRDITQSVSGNQIKDKLNGFLKAYLSLQLKYIEPKLQREEALRIKYANPKDKKYLDYFKGILDMPTEAAKSVNITAAQSLISEETSQTVSSSSMPESSDDMSLQVSQKIIRRFEAYLTQGSRVSGLRNVLSLIEQATSTDVDAKKKAIQCLEDWVEALHQLAEPAEVSAIVQAQIIDALTQPYYLLYMPSVTYFNSASDTFEKLCENYPARHIYVWIKNNLLHIDRDKMQLRVILSSRHLTNDLTLILKPEEAEKPKKLTAEQCQAIISKTKSKIAPHLITYFNETRPAFQSLPLDGLSSETVSALRLINKVLPSSTEQLQEACKTLSTSVPARQRSSSSLSPHSLFMQPPTHGLPPRPSASVADLRRQAAGSDTSSPQRSMSVASLPNASGRGRGSSSSTGQMTSSASSTPSSSEVRRGGYPKQ